MEKIILFYSIFCCLSVHCSSGVQILSKSKLEKCEKTTTDPANLNCTKKIVVNIAVPSGANGAEASIVAEVVEVEENSSQTMETMRIPPVITVNKSAAYSLYQLQYLWDVPFKAQEFYVKTRKCEPDAGAEVVKICERHPICCPCGNHRRVPSSCGNFFDKLVRGKANTAHCLRFSSDWFHVFSIGQRSLGFSVRIEVKTASKVSEVVVGPENRTATSSDNFLRVNLVGDFVGYTNSPLLEGFYLVTPRQILLALWTPFICSKGDPGQPDDLGRNFSMWMLLERMRFSLHGSECDKIGVSYEAFNGQPNFCSAQLGSCLQNQLWHYWEGDRQRINANLPPQFAVEGRFERINQHPNAGAHSFSFGITEVLNTNILIELSADDIEYELGDMDSFVKSPGKILTVTVPKFEALTQFGIATITTKNIGEVEASYSLTFDCSQGVNLMEEQFFILKPKEIATRSFKLYLTMDQAANYVCAAILKDSDFNEVDRAECQFTTTATIFDNGSQITPFEPPETGVNGFFESIESFLNKLWHGLADFITGKTCRQKCSSFFDFSCHIQYACLSWLVMFGLLIASFPTVLVLLWLLHQKGLFDALYDWWEDHVLMDKQIFRDFQNEKTEFHHPHIHHKRHHEQPAGLYKHEVHHRRKSTHSEHKRNHSDRDSDYFYHLHHVNREKHKHRRNRSSTPRVHLERKEGNLVGYHRGRKEKEPIKGLSKMARHDEVKPEDMHKPRHNLSDDETYFKVRGLRPLAMKVVLPVLTVQGHRSK
ncbi:Generative cell specific-1/HAP2 domain [Dillenia turbinata]|uniref:Generative cell specific-1/HAP2 domain n=1 Tax=Dillenia turbinata TaxID=194707 RepID=A0AAN8ZCE0_9MAGN